MLPMDRSSTEPAIAPDAGPEGPGWQLAVLHDLSAPPGGLVTPAALALRNSGTTPPPGIRPPAARPEAPRPVASHRPPGPVPAPVRTDIVFAGAHGGAGVSTLHALLKPSWDMGSLHHRVAPPGTAPIQTHGRPLVVVARNTTISAARATAAVRAMRQSGVRVAALVVISDGAGSEPREATARFRLLEDQVEAGIVRMPFVAALRMVDDPAEVPLPKAAQRALAKIRDLTGGPGTRPDTERRS